MRNRTLAFILFAAANGCGSDSPAAPSQEVPALPSTNAGSAATSSASTGSSGAAAPSNGSTGIAGTAATPVASGGTSAAGVGVGGGSGGAPTGGTSGASGSAGSAGSAPLPGALADINFMLDVLVPAGKELLECEYVAMPSDRGTIAVPAAESHYTPGSHHLLAYRTDLTALPTGQTGVWNCETGNWAVHDRGSYYEAQQPDSHRELPPGVAHEFKPGEVILLQAHYVNTTAADINAHVVLTLHTVEPSTIQQEAGSIIFSNTNIQLAPHSKSRVTMTCKIPTDFHPAELWSHMHKDAVNFLANTSDTTNASLGDSLYHEADWSEPQPRMYPYDPPVTIHAGSTITFSCDFDNETDNTIMYGDSALTNEMCILHGMYWPRMSASAEQCYGGMATRMAL